jgi:anti-sigma regulatory factor (Ser/Thr protein kinase)
MILTILTLPVYELIYWRRMPRNLDEWMLLRPDFGVAEEDCLDLALNDLDEVSESSEVIHEFCRAHDMEDKTAYYSALCLEEMAANVINHGFTHDSKTHSLNARVVYLKDMVMLRLKDDCIPFDPEEYSRLVSDEERFDNIGFRMVYKIADDVSYQNLLGLNVLTILIKETDLVTELRTDYMLERRLRELDPDLHRRFRDTAFISQRILSKFRQLFPEYTDHSELHSLTVIDSCNRLVGTEQVDMLSKSDIYVLLMAGYLHDVGMGISEKDYEEFKDVLGAEQYFKDHPDDTRADFVRTYHNEFSGLFIEKYAPLFDMPSDEFVFAIKQVSRGHRKTDLYDENEYPADYRMPDGTTVCLPYLAALIRLTDEIDVAASRNPLILYDIDLLTNEVSIQENRKLMAVEHLEMTKSSFILHTHEKDPEILDALDRAIVKMQETLDLCRDVTEKRTPFRITQKKVVLIRH